LFGTVESYWVRVGYARTEGSVFSFKLANTALKGRKLCLALVATVLSRNPVAVRTSLLALFGSHVRA
jgi:hypothetical protein